MIIFFYVLLTEEQQYDHKLTLDVPQPAPKVPSRACDGPSAGGPVARQGWQIYRKNVLIGCLVLDGWSIFFNLAL